MALVACVFVGGITGCKSDEVDETDIEEVTVDLGDFSASPADSNNASVDTNQSADEPVDDAGLVDDDDAVGESETRSDGSTEDAPAGTGMTLSVDPATVQLGSVELFRGIPGSGTLTIEQISEWMALPAVHQTIMPVLPLGMAAAAAAIQGIENNPLTLAKIELGRQLYFDTRLSSDGTISCASCHHPAFGWTKDTQFGVGVNDQTGNRNSPVSFNRIVSSAQFWDGRAASLEEQAVGPIANPIEMGNTHDICVKTVAGINGYRQQFERIFPDEGISIETIGKAIATFERALVTGPAPYDYLEMVRNIENQLDEEEIEYLEEDDPELFQQYTMAKQQVETMSESAIRGRDLFFSEKANCTACHAGANFSDEQYHNLGVGMEADEPDLGRFVVTGDDKDQGAFKTPTCRNLAMTGPYMHDGSQKTLEEVVEWYDKGGHPNPHLSDKMKVLNLTPQEKQDLVAFLKEGLEGTFPTMEEGRLPQ